MIVLCIAVIVSLLPCTSFAAENVGNLPQGYGNTYSYVEPQDGGFNGYYYTKKNPVVTYEWSTVKRISDDLETGPAGGSITSNKSVTFTAQIGSSAKGLTFSGSTSISSAIGYTLHVGGNRKAYMGYKVYYRVETGIREKRSMTTSKVVSTNTYTVKTIDHGSYCMVNVN